MPRSLDELMLAIIDYAGLFPPARLPLEPALRNFAAYRKGPHSRMLARFVCPANRLAELDAYADELFHAGEPPWRFSALGRSGSDAESFASGIVDDVGAMRLFMKGHGGRAIADALETRLPDSLLTECDTATTHDLVRRATDIVRSLDADIPAGRVQTFFEIPFLGEWRRNTRSAISAIAECNTEPLNPVGAKIRTGGVKASMIPSTEQVAFFIHECHEKRVRFKATAGLHHPLRHDSSEIDVATPMHGFINVFGAALLSHTFHLSEAALREVLEDESAEHFSFDDDGFRWRDHRVTSDQISRVRLAFAISFGSCSFIEPIEDLQALGLLRE